MPTPITSQHSKGFNANGPHYTGITFKKGFTTAQTPIDRAKFADCPTGNPTYAPTITSAEYRESVAAYKASVAQPAFNPSTLGMPNRNAKIQHAHNVEREAKRQAERAAHTCVDCGLAEQGNGQSIYHRRDQGAVLCTSCLEARETAKLATEETARIAAHCRIHTAYLLHDDGSCPECQRLDSERMTAAAKAVESFPDAEAAYAIRYVSAFMDSDDPWLPAALTDAQLAAELAVAANARLNALWVELERRTAPATTDECALTHTEPRVLVGAVAGGSGEDEHTCELRQGPDGIQCGLPAWQQFTSPFRPHSWWLCPTHMTELEPPPSRPIVNGEQFAPGYTPEAAAYEQSARYTITDAGRQALADAELPPTPPTEPTTAACPRPRMTDTQRQARAIQRASEQRAHVLALPGRPGFYVVRSTTDPRERYVVSVNDTGAIECSCRASEYRQPCWHAAKVQSRIIRESQRSTERKVAA